MSKAAPTTNTKIRVADLDYVQAEADERISNGVDLITAMILLWRSASEKRRAAAIRRVRKSVPRLAAA